MHTFWYNRNGSVFLTEHAVEFLLHMSMKEKINLFSESFRLPLVKGTKQNDDKSHLQCGYLTVLGDIQNLDCIGFICCKGHFFHLSLILGLPLGVSSGGRGVTQCLAQVFWNALNAELSASGRGNHVKWSCWLACLSSRSEINLELVKGTGRIALPTSIAFWSTERTNSPGSCTVSVLTVSSLPLSICQLSPDVEGSLVSMTHQFLAFLLNRCSGVMETYIVRGHWIVLMYKLCCDKWAYKCTLIVRSSVKIIWRFIRDHNNLKNKCWCEKKQKWDRDWISSNSKAY